MAVAKRNEELAAEFAKFLTKENETLAKMTAALAAAQARQKEIEDNMTVAAMSQKEK